MKSRWWWNLCERLLDFVPSGRWLPFCRCFFFFYFKNITYRMVFLFLNLSYQPLVDQSRLFHLKFTFNLRLEKVLAGRKGEERMKMWPDGQAVVVCRTKERIREPDYDFFEVKGDVRRLVFNQSCSSNTNRLVSFMVWITNLLSSPFIQPSVGHFGNLISSHEVLPKCMKGEERKGKDSWLIPTVDFQSLIGHFSRPFWY